MKKVNNHRTQWTKTKDLTVGKKIAAADLSKNAMFWDEIVSIEKVGREKVWDIEVDGTRNFVGNQIIAHNTYINGTASASGALSLFGTPTIQATANQTLILGGDTTGWLNFKPLNTDTLTIKPNLLALGTATIDGTGTLSLNTTNNQAITTGTGTFSVAGAATVSSSLAFGPKSADPVTCDTSQEGRVYYKGTTGTKRLYLCDGTAWVPIAAGTLTGGSSIDTISPEYPSAVISADGSNNTGTFTSDREATGSGSLYNFNYYEFTSAQTSLQDYDIYLRFRVPENFSSWVTSNALTVDFETEDTSTANNKIDVTIYQDNDADTVTSTSNASLYASTWHSSQTGGTPISFTAAQLNTGLTWSAGSIMTIKIKLYSKDNYFARVGSIKLDWQ